ncbi:MAG: hypothetical protein ACHQFZ_01770 [Acidimicrobiales bacterium]
MRPRVSKTVAGLALGLSLALVTPSLASADTGIRHAVRIYHQEVQAIDHQFYLAVAAAKQALVTALARATTPGQRNTARARYALAIAVATTTRDNALVALGPPPKVTGPPIVASGAASTG